MSLLNDVTYTRLDLLAPSDVDWFKQVQQLERNNWPAPGALKFSRRDGDEATHPASRVTRLPFRWYAAIAGTNTLLGYALLDCASGGPTRTCLDDFGVAPAARGTGGVAAHLLSFAIDDALRAGCDRPWTKVLTQSASSAAAVRAYERAGFQPVGGATAGAWGEAQVYVHGGSLH